jgi:hypothetical protein
MLEKLEREAMEEGGREGRRGGWREEEKREGGKLRMKTFRERWREGREKIKRER